MKIPTYQTNRLIIRPTGIEDAEFIFELMNTKEWIQYIGDRNIHSTEAAQNYIEEKMLPQLERLGFSNYTVIRKEDNTKIGTTGLNDREGLEGVDIGFAFLPQYGGQGYALEAAHKIMEIGQTEFGLKKINAITLPSNLPSRRLLEKLGLQYIKNIILQGDTEELMLYSWEAAK